MSAPKARCACRMPRSECVCDDDDVLDLPRDCGLLIRSMMGGDDPEPGPPYVHVFRFPEEPEGEPPPDHVPFTIERG